MNSNHNINYNNINRLELFKQNHDVAFNFLKKGIEYDEKKDYKNAREYYKEGIQCILQAERVPLSQSERYQSKIILDKLQKHKTNFYERLKEIDLLLQQNNNTNTCNNNNNTNNNNGLFNSFMKLFSSPKNTNVENQLLCKENTNNNSRTTSDDIKQLCKVNDRMNEPKYNTCIQSFGSSSSNNSLQKLTRSSSFEYNQQQTNNNITKSLYMPSTSSSSNNIFLNSGISQYLPSNNKSLINNSKQSIVNNNKTKNKLSLDKIPELKGIDKKLLDHILDEIIDNKTTNWDDISGLKNAKQTLFETVVLPSLRPDLFSGLRSPCKGVLLFGPPGNGKTLIAKACASQCNATFFSISASSIVSKWHGEGEKLVKCLFAAARYLQPSIIFIDEIDSILTSRSSNEHEASRRMKTEFLVQMDGVNNVNEDRVLVLGATNIPHELDEAILRRFTKRIYIPLPDKDSRISLIQHLTKNQPIKLSNNDLNQLAILTEGFSGSDINALCKETSMIPLRELNPNLLISIEANQIRPVNFNDFKIALNHIRPSTSQEMIYKLQQWNEKFGTFVK
ncbi:hypothetical protein ABK040_010850 [Willaertia magna]